ncbi:DNA polymerase B 2 [Rhizophagus diaphanus]|nr:DNA polymerase B 2 [Rhizophagus diaphanus] [Rhizophagus sp. MUCL 43196]
MAAWYNGTKQNIFDITQWGYNNQTMLVMFWQDLINNNRGRTCYFHNFGGYDAILAMPALLNLPFTFSPIMKDGEIISIKVYGSKKRLLLTIKDSIRVLPGALGKLAKDWGVETQKDHFPHYFWLNSIEVTLRYCGPIPAYEYFEPKRTSSKDYEEMKKLFLNRAWHFLEVSRQYIMGDCISLFQILNKYFETLISKFPINPLRVYSAPSTAFRIWRTQQLPLLQKDNLQVYDLSQNLDSELREGYCGGVVDVYRPHLKGVGYYYDVNSLYPTAMIKPMPVGRPKRVNLNPEQFLNGDFFGYVQATVMAPTNEYIGLLPIKYLGKLICPGGTFSGIFFSEELRFALSNNYQLLDISNAWEFKRGDNTFLQLITQLNAMKIEAQMNNQPTIRNMAKLLMNSMYGRFGMHPSILETHIWNEEKIINLAPYWDLINVLPYGELSLVSIELNKERLIAKHGLASLTEMLEKLSNKTNVVIAGAVTAYSRMIINQYKLDAMALGLELYYSDTDSLVLNGPLPESMIDSATLGKLKLEHTIKEGLFVMPKVYYLETTEETVVTKCKGYPGKLTKSQYLELLEGKSQSLEVTKWSRSLKERTVQILRKQSYELRFMFNKRQQLFNAEGQWFNTAPLILKQ